MTADGSSSPGLTSRFFRLALPNILSNLTVPLAGIIDLAILGHLDEIRHLAGVALGAVIFDYVYWTFGFLRMGTTGLTAQAQGRRDDDEVLLVAVRGGAIALLVAAAILALQRPLRWIAFAALGGTPEVELAGADYFDARIWAAPATLINFVLLGWFLGREQAGRALVMTLIANVTNVLLDWLFIVELQMEARGAGLATMVSQYAMLAGGLYFLLTDGAFGDLYRVAPRARRGPGLSEMLRLNRDILWRTFALVSTFAVFTNLSATMGTLLLASNAVLRNVVNLAAYFVDGFVFATESLAGIFRGQGAVYQLRQLLRLATGWGVATGLVFAAAFLGLPGPLFGLLTDHADVLAEVRRSMLWLLPILPIGSAAYVLDGYFLGLTEGAALRNAMLVSALVVFAPLAVLAYLHQSNTLLWLALTLFMVARTVTLVLRVPATFRGKP